MNTRFVKYTVKFAKISGKGHVYTKQIGDDVTVIDFKEYFKAMMTEEKYQEYYGYSFGTFSITEEQYKKL